MAEPYYRPKRSQTISYFDASAFRTQIACQLKNYNPSDYLDRNDIKRADPYTQYGLVAAAEALAHSRLDLSAIDPFDVGVLWASGQGGMQTFEEQVTEYVKGDGTPRFNPFFVPKMLINMASGVISMKHNLMGPSQTTVSACASSNSAIMDAFHIIKLGKAKVMLTGGSEAAITPASIGGFSSLKAMSVRNNDPQAASRPFDVERNGFVMGEGLGSVGIGRIRTRCGPWSNHLCRSGRCGSNV